MTNIIASIGHVPALLTEYLYDRSCEHEFLLCDVSLISLLLPVMSKRVRVFTSQDVATHNTAGSCWVTRDGKVYDITKFLPDHPGSYSLLLKYAGKDIGGVMKNARSHEHSDAAYDILDQCIIGRLGSAVSDEVEGMYLKQVGKPIELSVPLFSFGEVKRYCPGRQEHVP